MHAQCTVIYCTGQLGARICEPRTKNNGAWMHQYACIRQLSRSNREARHRAARRPPHPWLSTVSFASPADRPHLHKAKRSRCPGGGAELTTWRARFHACSFVRPPAPLHCAAQWWCMHAQVPLRCRYTAAEGDKGQGAGLVSGPKETAGKSQRPRGSQCSGRRRLRGQGVRPGVRPNTVCTRRGWEVVGSIDPSGCCGCCGFRGCCEHIVRVQGRFVRARRIQRSTRGQGWPPAPAAGASTAATINHRQGTTDRPSLPRTDKGMVGERLIATGIPLIWILVTCVRQQADGNVRWPASTSVDFRE